MLVKFQRQTWIHQEITRIGQNRFPSQYWPALEVAYQTCSSQLSVFIQDLNKEKALAGFILVCPPSRESVHAYKLSTRAPLVQDFYEMAFVAVDAAHEGKGLARKMLTYVMDSLRSRTTRCWLHVDSVNYRAKGLYESFGFTEYAHFPDPYGSDGHLMVFNGGNSHSKKRPALLNAGPCETKQTFSGSIFAPPLSASC